MVHFRTYGTLTGMKRGITFEAHISGILLEHFTHSLQSWHILNIIISYVIK